MNIKLFINFFDAILDGLKEEGESFKSQISKQLKVEKLKAEILSDIIDKNGRFVLEWRNITLSQTQEVLNSTSYFFEIDENANKYTKSQS